MKLFWRIKRDGQALWAEMFSDCAAHWFAARIPIKKRSEGKQAFKEFVEDVKKDSRA